MREAFDAFRRHTAQLQAQLRVLQAARKTSNVEPTGHAVRMDALHLIRAAAEFADTLERDAQTASATQLAAHRGGGAREAERAPGARGRDRALPQESERQRAEILNAAAKAEARDLLGEGERATRRASCARPRHAGNRLLEQSRHQATELTNAARAEVEQTLEWARAQATAVMARAQKGAEQLLAAAGLGEPAISQVVQSIVDANDSEIARTAGPAAPARPAQAIAAPPVEAPPVSAPPSSAPAPSAPPVSAPQAAPEAVDEPERNDDDNPRWSGAPEEAPPPAPPVTPFAGAEPEHTGPDEDGEPDNER